MADDTDILASAAKWSPDSDITSKPSEDTTPVPFIDKPLTVQQRRAGALPMLPPGSDKAGTAALDRGEKFLREHPVEPEEPEEKAEPTRLPGAGAAPLGKEETPEPEPSKAPVNPYVPPGVKEVWYNTEGSTFGTGLDGPDPDDNGVGHWGADTTDPYKRGIALPADAIATFYNVDPDDPEFVRNVRAGKILAQVYNPATNQYAIAPLVDEGPSERTGRGIDILQQTALDMGITNPRTWTGPLQFTPYYSPENTSTPNDMGARPVESPMAAIKPVPPEIKLPESPAAKWRKAHPEEAKFSDSELAKRVQGYLKLDKTSPDDFFKAFTANDGGTSLQKFYNDHTNALFRYRAKFPAYDNRNDSDLIGALYQKYHEKGETYRDFALRWKPLSDGNALSLINAGQDWVDNFRLLQAGLHQGTQAASDTPFGKFLDKYVDKWGDEQFGAYARFNWYSDIGFLTRGGWGLVKGVADWIKGEQKAAEQFHENVTKPLSEHVFGVDIFGFASAVNDPLKNLYRHSIGAGITQGLAAADQWDKLALEDLKRIQKDPWWKQFGGLMATGLIAPEGLATYLPYLLKFRTMQSFWYSVLMHGLLKAGNGLADNDPNTPWEVAKDIFDTGIAAGVMNKSSGRLSAAALGGTVAAFDDTLTAAVTGKPIEFTQFAKDVISGSILTALSAHVDPKLKAAEHRLYFEGPKVQRRVPGRKPAQGPVQLGGEPLDPGSPDVVVVQPAGNNPKMQIIQPRTGRVLVWIDVDALRDVAQTEANEEGRKKVLEALRLGQPIKAPELSLDARGRLQYADGNELDAVLNLGFDYIPVDIDAAAADSLERRGVILPWESGGDPDQAVIGRVNGEFGIELTPAQQQMLAEARQAFEAGDRPRAENLIGTIFAAAPEHIRARILRIAQHLWDNFDRIKPDSHDADETLRNAETQRPSNPEQDQSNPNGSLPTSPNLDAETFRLGAMRLADFQAHWPQIQQTLKDRLFQRFGIDPNDPNAQFTLWGAVMRFYNYLRPNGPPPIGLTQQEWNNLGDSTKHAIALEAAKPGVIIWYDWGHGDIAGYKQEIDIVGNPTGRFYMFDGNGHQFAGTVGRDILPLLVHNIFFGEPSARQHGPPTPGTHTHLLAYALNEFRQRGILDQVQHYFAHRLSDAEIAARMGPNVPEQDVKIVREALGIPQPNDPLFDVWQHLNGPSRPLTSLPSSGTVSSGQAGRGNIPGTTPPVQGGTQGTHAPTVQQGATGGVPPTTGAGGQGGVRGTQAGRNPTQEAADAKAFLEAEISAVGQTDPENVGRANQRTIFEKLWQWAQDHGFVWDFDHKGAFFKKGQEQDVYEHPTDPTKLIKYFRLNEFARFNNLGGAITRILSGQQWQNEFKDPDQFQHFLGLTKGIAPPEANDPGHEFIYLVYEVHKFNFKRKPTENEIYKWMRRKGFVPLLWDDPDDYNLWYDPVNNKVIGDFHHNNVIVVDERDAQGREILVPIDGWVHEPAQAKHATDIQADLAVRARRYVAPLPFPAGGLGPGWREVKRTTLLQDPAKELVEVEGPGGIKAKMIRDKPPPPATKIDDIVKMEKLWMKDQNGVEIRDANGRRKGYWRVWMTDKFGQLHERMVHGNKRAAEAQQKAMFDYYKNQRTGDPNNPHDPNANFYAGFGTVKMWDDFMDNLHEFVIKPLLQAAGHVVKPFAKGARNVLKWASGLPPIKNFYELAADVLGLDVEYKDAQGKVHKEGQVARGEMRRARGEMLAVVNNFKWDAAKRMGLAEKLIGGHRDAVRAAFWATKTRQYILNAIAGFQRGEVHPDPKTQAILEFYRAVQEAIYETERLFGMNYRHVDNYFYGIYKDRPREAHAAIARWENHLYQKFGGLPDYVKPKVFHDYLEADLHDYNAKFYNPEQIFGARVSGFFHNLNKILAFQGLREAGLAVEYDDPIAALWKRENGLVGEEGWWKAHNGEKYMFRPDVYHLVRNAFDPRDTVRLYGGWLINRLRWLKMVTSTLELGLSILHMKHIAGISVADVWASQNHIDKNTWMGRQAYRMAIAANAIRNMVPWDRIKLPDKVDPVTKKHTERFINLPFASWRDMRGVLAYMRGEGPRPIDPQSDHIINTLIDAGFGINQLHEGNIGFIDNMAEFMGGRGIKISQDWLDKLNEVPGLKGKVPTTGPVFLSWRSLGWENFIHGRMGNLPTLLSVGKFLTGESWFRDQMMHRQIPMAKMAAIMIKANELFIEHPELKEVNSPDVNIRNARQAALARIGHEVETRYGEMQYDNLFAARWLKTVGINSLLSMGWKIGMFRTYGKAVYDLGKNALHLDEIIQKKVDEDPSGAFLSGDMKFALFYTAVVGTQNLIISAILGRSQPPNKQYDLDPLDMVYPRIGTDNKGRPIRMRDPFWLGSYIELYRRVMNDGAWNGLTTTFGHWASPPVAILIDMAKNLDYKGREITDPDKSWVDPQTLWDRLTYVAKHVTPISLQNWAYNTRDPRDALWGFFGYSPASSWTMRTSTENLILDFADKHRAGTFIERRAYREKQDAVDQYKFALEKGSPQEIAQAREALRHVKPPLTERQVHAIIKHAELSPAEAVFKSLTKEDKASVLVRIPENERAHWLNLAGKDGLKAYHDLLKSQGKPIPHLAGGGIITEPTTAMVGESGAEAIIPLDDKSAPIRIISQPTLTTVGSTGKEAVVPLPGTASQGGEAGAIAGQIYPMQLMTAPRPPQPKPKAIVGAEIGTMGGQSYPLQPMRKGGHLTEKVFPWKDMEDSEGTPLPGDTVIPHSPKDPPFTTWEDYHDLPYNYGDKLPHNRGIPIPQDEDPRHWNPQLNL